MKFYTNLRWRNESVLCRHARMFTEQIIQSLQNGVQSATVVSDTSRRRFVLSWNGYKRIEPVDAIRKRKTSKDVT